MTDKRNLILYYLLFVLAYTALYFISSFVLMNYEDFWDDSRGEMWSFETMTLAESIAYIVWHIPVFPLGFIIKKGLVNLISITFINPILIAWSLQKVLTKYRKQVVRISQIVNSIIILLCLAVFAYILN